ncbi:MazG nucleotide pyrophosphohydrolase domain-containing protein [Patescibacteria group bacterium]
MNEKNEKIEGGREKEHKPQTFNKLVRDGIPEIIEENGDKPFTHIADDIEFERALEEKLREEIEELIEKLNSGEENEEIIKEMADVLEVLYTVCGLKGINVDEIEIVRKKKAEKRGGFKKRIILDRTE